MVANIGCTNKTMHKELSKMDRKKQLKQLYKETPIEAGVFQVKNIKNDKIFIGSTRNFKTLNGFKFMLEMGNNPNKELQEEWNNYQKEDFVFTVLEVLKPKETGYFDAKRELEKLEEKWISELQPFGENGYNQEK
jgi:hypothetical protein